MPNCLTIDFFYIVGNQNNGGNYPESNENFDLQFLDSTGNLLSETRIHTGGTTYSGGSNFTYISYTLTAVEKTAYYVRWFQERGSDNSDHYGLTQIKFGIASAGGFQSVQQDIDVRLENLPTVLPIEPNRLWKDSNGFLKIS